MKNKKSSINLFDTKSNKTVINEILIRHGKIELLYPPEIMLRKGRKSSSVVKQYTVNQTPSPPKKDQEDLTLPKIKTKVQGVISDSNRSYSRNSNFKLSNKHKNSINNNQRLNKITEFSSSPSRKHLSLIHIKNNAS